MERSARNLQLTLKRRLNLFTIACSPGGLDGCEGLDDIEGRPGQSDQEIRRDAIRHPFSKTKRDETDKRNCAGNLARFSLVRGER